MSGLRVRSILLTFGLSITAAKAEAPNPSEPTAKRLTDRGRIMVGGHIRGGWSNDDRTGWGAYNRWWLDLHPSVTYFLRDRIGAGIWIGGGTGSGGSSRVNQASVGVQGLFDLRLGPRVSLFVQPFAGFSYESQKEFRQFVFINGGSSLVPVDIQLKRQFVRLGSDLPLVFHVSESLAIGLGPEVTLDVFVKEESNLDAVTGASAPSRRRWRVITGVSSFIGASF